MDDHKIIFFKRSHLHWKPANHCSIDSAGNSAGCRGGENLTTEVYLLPKLRMGEAIPPFRHKPSLRTA
jgi:hypothetical protein